MKTGQPSRTATTVAFLRALADAGVTQVTGFSDPTARRWLTGGWARMLDWLSAHPQGVLASVARRGADLLALRTREIDEHLRGALASETRQVVLLGAGFDGRAFRLPSLQGCRVFEVDHPSTQACKRARVEGLRPTAAELQFVPLDFESESLSSALARAGHQAGERTTWVWEGVVMYLSDAAMAHSLRAVAERSAAGSRLIVQYHTPARMGLASRLILRSWGEPQLGARTPTEMAAALHAAGFAVVHDSGVDAWAGRASIAVPRMTAAAQARIVVGQQGSRAQPEEKRLR